MAKAQTMSKERMTMRAKAITALSALVVALMAAIPAQAAGPLSVESFTVGSNNTEAGAHPDLTTSIAVSNPGDPQAAEDVEINFPEGLFGNPQAIAVCRSADFALNQCPGASQAGIITILANYESDPNYLLGTAPLYNMEARGGFETARLAFVAPTVGVAINVPITVRTGSDYGLKMTVSGITQEIPFAGADITIWGFPADPVHDVDRFHVGSPGSPPGCPGLATTSCILTPYVGAGIPVKPYTDNPTVCTGQPLTATLRVKTYQDPANPVQEQASYPPTTHCEKQVFDPVLNLALTTDEADAPAGLDLQFRDPIFLGQSNSPSELRSATVTLPQGLTINPDAADGQIACTDAEANFGSDDPAGCPDNAKIGTFEIHTPALPDALTGSLYIGEPHPGNQYRVVMVAEGFGIHAKLVASVQPDPQTGQVTMSVIDLPQVPFEEFDFHLFASDRALMATPTQCTIYTAESVFTPWNASLSPQASQPIISIGRGPNGRPCPDQQRPFNPSLVAGSSKPVAGDFTDFRLKLGREDGDQFLGDLNFTMPPGLTASLRGLSYCPESAIVAAAGNTGRAEQATGSCPASSAIGTTNVAAGPGSHPFHAVGKMYLAGPFKGAPLSLVAVTPALAGPYDYGVVVVRVAIHVDPNDAHVIAISDTVPAIIGGIPLRLRSIQVNIDRSNFMINPTNCSPFSVDSQGIGDQGTVTDFSSYFQVIDCAPLPFKPKMNIRLLGGKNQTPRSKNPRLRFDLLTRKGDANIKSIAVTLSKAFQIDQRHLSNLCSRSQLEASRCAGRQPMGMAWVRTPLLDQPLQGPAYAVSGFGTLPRVVFILDGQVTVMPQAVSTSVHNGHLKTVVPVVPDVPIGHFRLTLLGGSKGYLINARDLCKNSGVIQVAYVGQNGKTRKQRIKPQLPCGGKRRAKEAR
jgi:hypothetical protein